MDEEDEGFSKWVSQVAHDASKNAIQECIDAGIPYVILRGIQLLKVYPNGTHKILKEFNYDELYVTLEKSKIYMVDKNVKD